MMKQILLAAIAAIMGAAAFAAGTVSVTAVEAQQRYPWNGLVDIVVSLECSADEIGAVECSIVATNSATGATVPITSVVRNGDDSGSGTTWTRRYIWNAANDVGAVKVDDLALTVDAKLLGGVQLWENGPYWAECNVGATKPEDYGYYFWWGDTVGYKRNAANDGWVSVKDGSGFSFSSGNCPTYGKDNTQLQSAGYIDATGNLVAAHDAAAAHLGAPWRMPTDAEFSALISKCNTTWTTRGGVYGRLVTGRGAYASKSIFLPAAGYGNDSSLSVTAGSDGAYSSSSPHSSGYASGIYFYSDGFLWYDRRRDCGQPVRPIRGFAKGGYFEIVAGVTTHLKLDCRTGMRAPSPDGEVLWYDASWYKGGDEVRITDNETVVVTGTVGSCVWHPKTDASAPHLLQLEVLSGGQVIGTETAQFVLGYIRNVTARQLWPHNKVALSFTVADDIGEVKGADEDLSVWCVFGTATNAAARILGDRSAKPGVHRIIWDMESEGLWFANAETIFGVSFEEVSTSGVQLWENGPYWAECNVGASKPEEYGYYFWWGDTIGYKRNADNNGWVSVKDGTLRSFSSCPTYGKYNNELQSRGYSDSSGNLVAAHDAATVHLGAPWRMPTDAEFVALISNCTTTWITTNGVYGRLITGRGAYASKSIFLPAAGRGDNSNLNSPGSGGYYWSLTSSSQWFCNAWQLDFNSGQFMNNDYGRRYSGQPVRPVRGFSK